jgi:FkbM family methyltransferase
MGTPTLLRLRLGDKALLVPPTAPNLFYETWVLRIYDSLNLRPGDVVLDIGANIGDFAILASHAVGPNGLVVAVEPHPKWYTTLVKNISVSKQTNIVPIRVAIADRTGILSMTDDAVSGLLAGRAEYAYSVPSLTLDELLIQLKLNAVTAMKMDIEGFEREALKHQKCLARMRNIIVETHSQELYDSVHAVLEDSGFELTRLGLPTLLRTAILVSLKYWPWLLSDEISTNFFGLRNLGRMLSQQKGFLITDNSTGSLSIICGRRPDSTPC